MGMSISPSYRLAGLAALLAGLTFPAAAQAQVASAVVADGPGRLDWTVKPARVWPRRPVVGLSMAVSETSRVYGVTLAPIDKGRVTTALEYRITPRGPVGSIGLQPSLDSRFIDPANPYAGLVFGPAQPEVTVGARLRYRF
jgi:hypothetical protein